MIFILLYIFFLFFQFQFVFILLFYFCALLYFWLTVWFTILLALLINLKLSAHSYSYYIHTFPLLQYLQVFISTMKKLSADYGRHLQLVKYSQQPEEQDQKTNLVPPLIQQQIFNKQGFNLCQVLGNFNDAFIICYHQEKIFVVDQHAASEKSLYVKFLSEKNLLQQKYEGEPFQIQNLYKQVLCEQKERLKSIGWAYEIVEQGPIFMKVKLGAVPSIFGKKCRQGQFLEIIQSQYQKSMQQLSKSQKQTMATMACHNSYRIGDKLSKSDMRQLVDTLYQIGGSFNCPHSRPTVISLGRAQQFKNAIMEDRQYSLM